MSKQVADRHQKAPEHPEQTAHQQKQTRRAMRRTNMKKDTSCPPRAWRQPTGDPSWD